MKKLSVLLITLFVSTSALAQRGKVRSNNDFSTPSGGSAVTGYLGFGQGAVNAGADFETPLSADAGMGGYFLFFSDAKKNGATIRPQVISFGGQAKIHYRPGAWDLYAAPGFGIVMYDDNSEDETTLGPSMRLGVLYSVSPSLSVGLEHGTLFNWFSKDIPGEHIETTYAAARIKF